MTEFKAFIDGLKKKQQLPIESEIYVTTIAMPRWIREYCDKEKVTPRQLIELGILTREAKK